MTIIAACSQPHAFGTKSELQCSLLDGSVNTYCATVGGGVAFAGDVFQIQGVAGVVVRVTRVDISITGPTAAVIAVALQRRSTADTGGSPQAISFTKNDSGDPAPGAAPVLFTGAPTTGTPVGTARQYMVPVTVVGSTPAALYLNFGNGPSKALILRGANDFICINLSGSLTGASSTMNVEWTESSL